MRTEQNKLCWKLICVCVPKVQLQVQKCKPQSCAAISEKGRRHAFIPGIQSQEIVSMLSLYAVPLLPFFCQLVSLACSGRNPIGPCQQECYGMKVLESSILEKSLFNNHDCSRLDTKASFPDWGMVDCVCMRRASEYMGKLHALIAHLVPTLRESCVQINPSCKFRFGLMNVASTA
jgi:hypothetical protein